MRLSIAAAVACLSIVGVAAADQAAAAIKKFTDIPAQELGSALQVLAQERDFQVVYLSDSVGTLRTSGAVGEFTADDALKKLLKGTGLSFRYLDEQTITVLPTHGGSSTSAKGNSGVRATAEGNVASAVDGAGQSGDSDGGKDKAFWDRFRVAQTETKSSSPSPGTGADEDKKDTIQEIIVTAQKREERLQDVPVPVTAISAETLADTNQLLLSDYYAQIPSLTITEGSQSSQSFNIRGLPASTILIDDVPANGRFPDIDPGNLARVEILRGPQGTLYGASGLGGLIKYVTVDPSSDQISGRLEAGTDSVHNGYDLGYNTRGSINLPVTEDLAIRLGAFWRQDAGYIDNPLLGIDGINRDSGEGATLTALWRPAESFSLRFNALYQSIKGGNMEVTPYNPLTLQRLGNLQQEYVAGDGPYDRNLTAFSLILKDKVGDVELTSLSGFNLNRARDYYDYSFNLGSVVTTPAPPVFPGFGAANTGVVILDRSISRNYSQEFRLESPIGKHLDLYVGAYYTYLDSSLIQDIPVSNPDTGVVAGNFGHVNAPSPYYEYAGYADLTYHLNDAFDIQFGGRESHLRQESPFDITGYYAAEFLGGNPYIAPTGNASSNTFTYLVTPRYRISGDWMLYARAASGFSPGGANVPGPNTPPQYGPEQTRNYELGTKGDFLDHMLSIDASIYYIDFVGLIQGFVNKTTGVSYITNAGAAKSQGLELSVEARPLKGLRAVAWLVFSDAQITNVPEGVALANLNANIQESVGDQLPNSSRFSGNLSVDQDISLLGASTGFIGTTLSYMGRREGNYAAPGDRQVFPAYAKIDLRAGVKINTWKINLYANNVANRRAVLSSDNEGNEPAALYLIQPRTIGLSVSKAF